MVWDQPVFTTLISPESMIEGGNEENLRVDGSPVRWHDNMTVVTTGVLYIHRKDQTRVYNLHGQAYISKEWIYLSNVPCIIVSQIVPLPTCRGKWHPRPMTMP